MAIKGIYTAVSGAKAQSQRLDTIANNIANVDTPGFKKDRQVFKEYLTSYEKLEEVLEAPRIPASIDSFYPLNGGDKSYVDSAGTATDFAQGSVRLTNNPLDIAIDGDAFFEIQTPQGIRYSRNGHFTKSSTGQLVTKDGFPVLNDNKETGDIRDRYINVGEKTFTVAEGGEVSSDGVPQGKLSMVSTEDRAVLLKVGNSFYKTKETINSPIVPAKRFSIHQGAIEKSNINIVNEMTEMIKTTRVFESTQKAIQAYDQMNGRLVNDVPKLR